MIRTAGIIFAMAAALSAASQSIAVFPQVQGTWDVLTTTWDPWNGNMNFLYWPHTLSYYPEVSEEAYDMNWGAVFEEPSGTQVGWIAVDGQKVLYRAESNYFSNCAEYSDTTVKVLYDFDMVVGDTAYIDNPLDWPIPAIVNMIDTVELNWLPARRYLLSNNDEWVTGMGSVEGLLRPFLGWFECGYGLVNFCGVFTSDSTEFTACWQTPVGVAHGLGQPFDVFPVPASDHFHVSGVSSGTLIRLIDLHGRTRAVERSTSPVSRIRLAGIEPGLYVVDVEGLRTKLIIQ